MDNIHELAKFVETDVKVEEPAKEEKNQNTNNANSNDVKNDPYPYYIKVNYGANVVTIYTKDSNGNYTKPFKAMVCSSGTYTPTSGKYKIQYRWRWLGLVGGVYGQYSTQIVGDILFHSVPYTAKSEDKLEYWEYDKLGTTASAGCIRLQTSDAKWIYDNVPKGTVVEFYSDSNPGPLGKPSAMKISDNETCRNWDPTDPNANNPWKTYQEPVVNKTPEPQNVEEKSDETSADAS